MGVFAKKGKAAEEEDVKRASQELNQQHEKKDNDSKACYSHLEAQFLMKSHGVVLKLYIENFKRMNDLFGMEYCDELLEEILKYLEQKTGCVVYRYVGVEFIIIMKNRTIADASWLVEQLTERFNESWTIKGTDCLCSVQIALCAYPGYASNVGEILKYLDMAVSHGAERGSNQAIVYDNDLHQQFVRRQIIAKYLNTAIAKGETEVSYRPIYDREKKGFSRAEFQMRIFVPELGMIDSSEYLSIAEDTGQIRQVEYYALDRAAAAVAGLLQKKRSFDSIALPISSMLLLQGDFLQEVSRVMEMYELPPKKLAIEIDEYAAVTSYARLTVLLQGLSWMGVELILNNFGSGSTGLSRIFDLPVDTLKFNRTFVGELENSAKFAPVIGGLVQIAKKMKKKVIAEGVETQRQRDFLDKFGCTMQMGSYYSPVIPEKELLSVLRTFSDSSR